ncbi:hypothetical protein DFJ74DRAFT_500382 [Hyaloraphidium curvatum]|nr:hypothetical protein DFJ74DRAFT_500382 [Hyaloraphidium curvatum]
MAAATNTFEATSPTCAQPPASEDADAPGVALPPELALDIMGILEAAGAKRTLLRLLSTCRLFFPLGLGLMVRRIEVSPPSGGDVGERSLDPYRGLLSDALGTGKLGCVEEPSVSVWRRDSFYAEFLRGVGPSLKVLEIVASSRAGVDGILESIGAARTLRHVRIRVQRYSDSGLRARNKLSDDYLPLLHLEWLGFPAGA